MNKGDLFKDKDDVWLEEKVKKCLQSIRNHREPDFYQRGICMLSAGLKKVSCRYFSDNCSFKDDNSPDRCYICKYKP